MVTTQAECVAWYEALMTRTYKSLLNYGQGFDMWPQSGAVALEGFPAPQYNPFDDTPPYEKPQIPLPLGRSPEESRESRSFSVLFASVGALTVAGAVVIFVLRRKSARQKLSMASGSKVASNTALPVG